MADLELNQSRLQTYAKCQRRFFLQYMREEYVPSRAPLLPAEQEAKIRQGELFHRHVEGLMRGLDEELVLKFAPDPVGGWLNDALGFLEQLPSGDRLAEFTIALPFRGAKLTAKYDLLVVRQERALIVDWKTSEEPAKRYFLERSMQHRVFPFVLAEAAPAMGWPQVGPESIEVVYWNAGEPKAPSLFMYSQREHQGNRKFLTDRIAEIRARDRVEGSFPKVPDTPENRETLCNACAFVFHCERGDDTRERRNLASVFYEADLELAADADAGSDLDLYEIPY